MRQYLTLLQDAMDKGIRKTNRTGVDHFGYFGDMMQFDLADGFPAVTTKRLAFKSVVAEMLSFLRGYDNVKDFQALGCKVWDANAEADYWVNNPNCKGDGDLGRIYGRQAREYLYPYENTDPESPDLWRVGAVDQLKMVYDDLCQGIDNRREIVTHWNPGELDQMALPPCHMFYQFNLHGGTLNLLMYQRSCDVPLGIPFNIAGYAWLLAVMAQVTGHKAGVFTHMMGDIHIYENQIEFARIQAIRQPLSLPVLEIDEGIKTLEDLETWVTPDHFELVGYEHHPHIAYPFAV